MKNVARGRSWKIRQEVGHVGDANVRRRRNDDRDRVNGLGAAATGHTGWRAGAVVASGQLVTGAGLVDDEARDIGRAERQQADDDCEDEPAHEAIVAPSQAGPSSPSGRMDVRPRLVQWKCSMADLPIVCSLTPAALTARKAGFLSDLLKRAQRHEELPQGYRLELAPTEDTLTAIARTLEAERQCCRFLRFSIVVEPDGGPIALELTGPPGTTEFISALFDG